MPTELEKITLQMVVWYTTDHLSCSQIAVKVGWSAPTIAKRLRSAGVIMRNPGTPQTLYNQRIENLNNEIVHTQTKLDSVLAIAVKNTFVRSELVNAGLIQTDPSSTPEEGVINRKKIGR